MARIKSDNFLFNSNSSINAVASGPHQGSPLPGGLVTMNGTFID
jgi:hypothetical protein